MPNPGWISLESCIYDYISQAELSQAKYFKLYHLAFRCMEKLGLSFFYEIRSIKLDVLANKTAALPPGFLKYTKVGVLNNNGELAVLKYNEKLTTLADLRSNRIAETSSTNFLNYYSYSSPIFFNWWNGENFNNLYGISGVGLYGGGFKIDEANGVIILDPSFGWTGLVLEYIASPDEGTEYYVPMEFREAIIAWLAWQDIVYTKGATSHFGLGDKRDRRHDYFEARRHAIAEYQPFYLDQAYINSMDAARLVVKSG